MHKLFKIFHFIDEYKESYLEKIDKNVSIIYRNYNNCYDLNTILSIKNYCKKKKVKFFLANNHKYAWSLRLDGYYIPAFNNSFAHLLYPKRKNFSIIGSAHNISELKKKEKQQCEYIFLSPIFRVKKKENFLGLNNFRNLKLKTSRKLIALGGINTDNLNKINISNSVGFASISMLKKKAQI